MKLDQIAHHPEAQVVTKFTHEALECIVLNMRDRHYCGYVRTPFDGHHEEFQSAVNVHGGLTYGIDQDGWIGFDTAHATDVPYDVEGNALTNNPLATMRAKQGFGDEHDVSWKPADVVEETKCLAEQVNELIPEGAIEEDAEIIDSDSE